MTRGRGAFEAQFLAVPLRGLVRSGENFELRIKETPGARVKTSDGPAVDVPGKSAVLRLVSLSALAAHLSGRTVTVHLTANLGTAVPKIHDWFLQTKSISAEAAAFAVTLANGRDLLKLAPLLAGSGSFAVAPGRASWSDTLSHFGLVATAPLSHR